MRFADWPVYFLKSPYILHDIRTDLLVDLIANDVAGIGGRNRQQLGLEVGHQLPILHAKQRGFQGILVLYLVVFALDGNAPTVNAVDLCLRIEVCAHGTESSAVWAKYLVCAAFHMLDLPVRLHIQDIFG